MQDSIETLLKWRQKSADASGVTEQDSTYVKQILKEIHKTFPCEWDEVLNEIEVDNQHEDIINKYLGLS